MLNVERVGNSRGAVVAVELHDDTRSGSARD
jgi:hypothetical protein